MCCGKGKVFVFDHAYFIWVPTFSSQTAHTISWNLLHNSRLYIYVRILDVHEDPLAILHVDVRAWMRACRTRVLALSNLWIPSHFFREALKNKILSTSAHKTCNRNVFCPAFCATEQVACMCVFKQIFEKKRMNHSCCNESCTRTSSDTFTSFKDLTAQAIHTYTHTKQSKHKWKSFWRCEKFLSKGKTQPKKYWPAQTRQDRHCGAQRIRHACRTRRWLPWIRSGMTWAARKNHMETKSFNNPSVHLVLSKIACTWGMYIYAAAIRASHAIWSLKP
jgi:hypothetical protein